MKPSVSVIIPCFNGELYLEEAIKSIIEQSYLIEEIIIVDNGSEDNTKLIAEKFDRVKYHVFSEQNQARARNYGCYLAKGDYVAFLDQDDIWMPHKTKLQIEFLEHNQRYFGVIAMQKMFLQASCQKPAWLKKEFLDTPQLAYLPSTLMIKKSLFERGFQFDENYHLASDVAWFFKAKDNNLPIGIVHEVVLLRRIHNHNASSNLSILHSEYLRIIQKSLKHQRGKIVGEPIS